jgi:tetratricopeptide (TPR) repeat protein
MAAQLPIELFYSYAHEDEKYRIELEKYLKDMQRAGIITTWYDRRITGGSDLDRSISEYVDRAHVIFFLLSADFIASEYANDVELKRALERHDRGEARVVGVVARPIPKLRSALGKTILIPTDGKAIKLWRPQERGYVNVVEHLERIIEETRAQLAARDDEAPLRRHVWSIPKRNPTFVGREHALQRVGEALAATGTPSTVAIVGPPGVGKTQIAFEYAYRHASEYDVAWAIRAEDTNSIVVDLSALAEQLGVAGEGSGREAERPTATRVRRSAPIPGTSMAATTPANNAGDVAVDGVMNWLAENGRWLLIFDNAAQIASVTSYIPRQGVGHVIVTSRENIWGMLGQTVELETFRREESVQFLSARTGGDASEIKSDADRLANSLGDMPLALEHAASFVNTKRTTLAAYSALIDAVAASGPTLDDPVGRIAATWSVSLDQIGPTSPAALLFAMCAWLAPEDIPRSIFTSGVAWLGKRLASTVADPPLFADAIAQLARYGLVRVRGDAFTTHRLVQVAARDRLSQREQRAAAAQVVGLLHSIYPDADSIPDSDSWELCERYLPHVITATGHAIRLEVELPAVAHLLWRVGDYQGERARYLEAQSTLQQALSVAQAAHGLSHPLIADIQNSIGNVLLDGRGDYDGAKRRYEAALIVDRALGAERTHDAAIHLNNVGYALEQQSHLKLAMSYYTQSLDIEAELDERAEAAKTMLNVGSIHETLGDGGSARKLYEDAIDILRAAAAEPNELADALSALGSLLLDGGDTAGSRERFMEALALNRSVYGTDDHPEIARNLTNLARVLLAAGDLVEARRHTDEALGMYARVYALGTPNPALGAAYYVLGEIHEHQREWKDAQAAYETALEHDEGRGNAMSLGVAEDLAAIARVLVAMGDPAAALTRYQHAYRLYANVYGEDHAFTRELATAVAALESAGGDEHGGGHDAPVPGTPD